MEPGIPDLVIENNEELHIRNGRMTRGMTMIVPEDVFEQFRLGYRCLKCLEPFGGEFAQPAMPARCDVCGYEVKKRQLAELEFHDIGARHTGPTPLEVIDAAYEEGERMRKDGR